jgi:phenylacetate-coenzyme A ligase PaaK-like adenylate-forming protein
MYIDDLRRLEDAMRTPEKIAQTVDYLADNLRKFLRSGDKLIICFADSQPGDFSDLLAQAAKKLGVTVLIPEDLKWKTMLQLAFRSRANAISAPPFVVLGLTKIARYTNTPLYFRHVLTAGYRCTGWMIQGIQRGLDCLNWGVLGPGTGPLISGFSCQTEPVIHFRDDIFDVQNVDKDGNVIPDDEMGNLVLIPKEMPHLRYNIGEIGRIRRTPCACGCTSPLWIDVISGADVDPYMEQLGRELLNWTSILDVRLNNGESGLEVELVVFPGEKMPVLPQCAKRVIRNWDPERDVPFWFNPDWRKNEYNS